MQLSQTHVGGCRRPPFLQSVYTVPPAGNKLTRRTVCLRWSGLGLAVLFSYARTVAADNPISQLNMKLKAVKDKGI